MNKRLAISIVGGLATPGLIVAAALYPPLAAVVAVACFYSAFALAAGLLIYGLLGGR